MLFIPCLLKVPDWSNIEQPIARQKRDRQEWQEERINRRNLRSREKERKKEVSGADRQLPARRQSRTYRKIKRLGGKRKINRLI